MGSYTRFIKTSSCFPSGFFECPLTHLRWGAVEEGKRLISHRLLFKKNLLQILLFNLTFLYSQCECSIQGSHNHFPQTPLEILHMIYHLLWNAASISLWSSTEIANLNLTADFLTQNNVKQSHKLMWMIKGKMIQNNPRKKGNNYRREIPGVRRKVGMESRELEGCDYVYLKYTSIQCF